MSAGKPPKEPQEPERDERKAAVEAIFKDDEARANLVGFFNVVLQIDRRLNPDLYD